MTVAYAPPTSRHPRKYRILHISIQTAHPKPKATSPAPDLQLPPIPHYRPPCYRPSSQFTPNTPPIQSVSQSAIFHPSTPRPTNKPSPRPAAYVSVPRNANDDYGFLPIAFVRSAWARCVVAITTTSCQRADSSTRKVRESFLT